MWKPSTFHVAEIEHSFNTVGIAELTFKIAEIEPSYFQLSPLTQIFEKLIYKQLISYFQKLGIVSEYQFGFRKGRCTAQDITEIAYTLRKAVDNNLYTCGIFLDFSKAFDTVNHSILLQK